MSGNPSGRPTVPKELLEARRLAAQNASEGVRALLDVIRNAEKDRDRVAAVKELREWADRAAGMGPGADLAEAPVQQRIEVVKALLGELEAEAKR